ncbi:MAG: hypothetical protein IBX57_00985 [Gammaproteobacteria bacterium]|nr:hypothetical protein [Gammaproteobacteria bacterium]
MGSLIHAGGSSNTFNEETNVFGFGRSSGFSVFENNLEQQDIVHVELEPNQNMTSGGSPLLSVYVLTEVDKNAFLTGSTTLTQTNALFYSYNSGIVAGDRLGIVINNIDKTIDFYHNGQQAVGYTVDKTYPLEGGLYLTMGNRSAGSGSGTLKVFVGGDIKYPV